MKSGTLILALAVFASAATVAHAQTATATADPLTDLQNDFGAIVGEAFHRPDPIIAATTGPGSGAPAAGVALRTSLEVPGAVFAGLMQPFGDADKADAPAPAPAPLPHRHARIHHHRAATQG